MILRDYLVQLGFKIDENGWRGFNDKLATTSRNAARMGSTVAAAAVEIGVATEKVARQYEELYYVSQRSGSTVAGIRAQAFAFGQIGSNADAARASIEGMAAAARLNPGVKAMFAGMGIDMSNPTKGVGQLVDNLKSRFGEAGYFVAAKFAEMAGMDESTFRQVWMNREKQKAQEEEQLRRQKEAGIDAQKFAEDSVRFGDKLRVLQDRWGLIIDRVAIAWLPVLEKAVDVGNDSTAWMTRADVASKGWLGTLGSIVAALGVLKATGAALGAAGRLVGLGGAASVAGGASLGLRAMAFRALGPVGAFAWGLGLGGEAQGATMPGGAGKAHPDDMPKTKGGLAAAIAATAAHLGIDPLDLATAISYETGGTFKGDKRGPTTKWGQHVGLIQMGEPQRAQFGYDPKGSPEEQMAAVERYLKAHGVKPGMKMLDIYSAINAGAPGLYNRSDAGAGGAPGTVADKVAGMGDHRNNARALLGDTPLTSGGGGATVSINQKNDIRVSGVSDPSKAAGMVGNELGRTNGDIVRNTANAVH